jgi:kynureninase
MLEKTADFFFFVLNLEKITTVTFNTSQAFYKEADANDALSSFRKMFILPKAATGREAAYFCGNSLGLQPAALKELVESELADWGMHGVEGHFLAKHPWFGYHHLFAEGLGKIVGALPNEVVAMNSLTVNLHLLMISFYRPTASRYKIIMEAGAFPSDQYAMETQVQMHGLDPKDAIIEIAPRAGHHLITEQDILDAIATAGDSVALVLFGGVNYYTGQFFDLEKITSAAHAVGAYAGFDLAHAVGNVPLQLHDWGVDFACWCTYKYLNAGPGAVGGAYVHENHCNNDALFRLGGWWGNDEATRFKMEKGFVPQKNAGSWQMSNAPVFNMTGLLSSLNIYAQTSVQHLRTKSIRMTAYLEYLLGQIPHPNFEIITPKDPQKRGCQLSLLFSANGKETFHRLTTAGIIADWREPNVIRLAPVPLYNSFKDCYRVFEVLSDKTM